MVKHHVGKIRFTAWCHQFHLPTNVCKSLAQFKQKASYIFCQFVFQIPFVKLAFHADEIKVVWVFDYLLC